MPDYLFLDRSKQPAERQLKDAISDTYEYWIEIKNRIAELYGDTKNEWKFYSKKSGWTLKTLLKKRNLFFFQPFANYFSLTFVFGDKAANVIEESDLSETLKRALRGAKKYAEGRSLLVDVKTRNDLVDVNKLIDIKIKN
jgi:hypothetical protein